MINGTWQEDEKLYGEHLDAFYQDLYIEKQHVIPKIEGTRRMQNGWKEFLRKYKLDTHYSH